MKEISRKQKDLDDGLKAFQWNKTLMSLMGLWPISPSHSLFFVLFTFYSSYMVLEYLDLLLFIDDFDHVLLNVMENMALSEIFIRILTLRLYNREIGYLIREIKQDFNPDNYSSEERDEFLKYLLKARILMKALITSTICSASSYYLKPALGQLGEIVEYVGSSNENASLIYLLPYRFYSLHKINDASTYFWTYLSQLPFLFVSGTGQCAADCLIVTLAYYVSGQLAVLTLRITNIDTDPSTCTEQLHKVVRAHAKLLRIGAMLEEMFGAMLLSHFIGATIMICIMGYQVLICLAIGEKAALVSLVAVIFLAYLILYAHCVVCESLITESKRVSEAYYNCNWYNMSQENVSTIILCMARSQKPLRLSAGKFSTFCLKTLTDSIKTSMSYLSVLRAVM